MILYFQQVSANNILLLHLGIINALLCILFLIFSVPSIARSDGSASFEATLCTLHGFLLTAMHPVALWTICCLNCDRYYAIAAPLHYGAIVNTKRVCQMKPKYRHTTNHKAFISVCGVKSNMKILRTFAELNLYIYLILCFQVVASLAGGWLVAIALCIPPLFQVAPYQYNSDLGACVPHFAMTGSLSYAIVFTVTTLVIPGALIIGCNIRVSWFT